MENKTPEISLNPLVEYVYASSKRKMTILKSQKHPSSFIVARYRTARAAFSDFFKQGYDINILIRAIEKLQNKETLSDWSTTDKHNSIYALNKFLEIKFPFVNLKCNFRKPSLKSYSVKGVNIIVAPDLILEWEQNGVLCTGAIKFSIKKKALSFQEGQLASSLLVDFMKSILPHYKVEPQYCICVDVMNSRIFSSSDNFETSLKVIKDACEEINVEWNK